MYTFRTHEQMVEGSDTYLPDIHVVRYDETNDNNLSIYYAFRDTFRRIVSMDTMGNLNVAPVITIVPPMVFEETLEVRVSRTSGLQGNVEVLRGDTYFPMWIQPEVEGEYLIFNFLKPETGRIT